jgi:hypothetical protein
MIRVKLNSLVLGMVMVLGFAAVAFSQASSRSITINRDSKVGGQALPKGNYTIKFTEDKDGEVVVLKGKQEMVKAPYKLTKLEAAPADNTVIYAMAEDGSLRIKRIEFKGKNMALSLE